MTPEQLNQPGFIFLASELSIEPIIYRDYLREYGQDLTTSPHGVADRIHTREILEGTYIDDGGNIIWKDDYDNLGADEQDNYKWNGEVVKEWQIWSWGVGGNHPYYTGISFDNEEDAKLYYYERCEWYVQEKNWDAPIWFDNYEESLTEFANSVDKSEDVVKRYMAISHIAKRKETERRELIIKQNEERKAWLTIEVPKEANSIVVDDEFKVAVKWAEEVAGNEKSNRLISATKALLQRNGKDKINTDFWQVVRILKAKVSNF
jgi:hypothetical protein